MDVDLKEMFPREYQLYRHRIVEHPPKGMTPRPELLGEDGFAIFLERFFEGQRQADERKGLR